MLGRPAANSRNKQRAPPGAPTRSRIRQPVLSNNSGNSVPTSSSPPSSSSYSPQLLPQQSKYPPNAKTQLQTQTQASKRKEAAAAKATVKLQPEQSATSSKRNSNKSHNHTISTLGPPQNEATRYYYEKLILRGITLLQPYNVLFIAEAYHAWYHSADVDIATEVLQQTIGTKGLDLNKHTGDRSCQRTSQADSLDSTNKRDAFESSCEIDIRSMYWLALCYWHIGEITTVYKLLTPVIVEVDFIIDRYGGDTTNTLGSNESSSTSLDSEASTDSGTGQIANECVIGLTESPNVYRMKALAGALWILGMACMRLEKWQEAEDALSSLADTLKLIYMPDDPSMDIAVDLVRALGKDSIYTLPTPADVSDLLAQICLRTNRSVQCGSLSLESLQRNPLLWSSCRRMCDLSHGSKAVDVLKSDISLRTSGKTPHMPTGAKSDQQLFGLRHPSKPLNANPNTNLESATNKRSSRPVHYPASGLHSQNSTTGIPEPSSSSIPSVPATRMRTRLMTHGAANANTTLPSRKVASHQRPASGIRQLGLSSKMQTRAQTNDTITIVTERKRSRNGTALRTAISSDSVTLHNAKTNPSLIHNSMGHIVASQQLDKTALCHIQELFRYTGKLFSSTSEYKAVQALSDFSRLPTQQQNSAWGLCVLGRICFEIGRYPEAARAFSAAHALAPYRVRDMDTYSTLLWHMKREEALADLAHTLISTGRNWSPEAWMAVANCFSLDGDHQAALRCLTRSTQLYNGNPSGSRKSRLQATCVPRTESGGINGLAYAYTLSGHEYVATNDLDHAQQSFRTALRLDSRHYNAWYGLGMVYLRLGKLDLSEYHFKRALALNQHNPLLLQSIGAVYEHQNNYQRALAVYSCVERMLVRGATKSTPRSSLAIDQTPGNGASFETPQLRESSKGKRPETADSAADGGAAAVPPSVTENGIVLQLNNHPAMNFVLFKRARVLVMLERFSDAVPILERLMHRCPREFNVPFLLGQVYTRLRRNREAAACFSKALDIAPYNAPSVREALDVLYQQDADDEASRSVAASPRSSPCLGGMQCTGGSNDGSWSQDWKALDGANDRVDRALEFDL